MKRMLRVFANGDAGSAVVDWAVLAAGATLLILSIGMTLAGGAGADTARAGVARQEALLTQAG